MPPLVPASTNSMPRARSCFGAAHRVVVVGVAAVDDDVARREQRRSCVDRRLHRRAGRHHHPDGAPRRQLRRPGRRATRRRRRRRFAEAATASALRSDDDDAMAAASSRSVMLAPIRPRPTMPMSIVVTSVRGWPMRRRARRASRAAARPASTSAPRWTRRHGPSVRISDWKSPIACARLSWPNVNGFPGYRRSSRVVRRHLQEHAVRRPALVQLARSSAGSAARSRASSPTCVRRAPLRAWRRMRLGRRRRLARRR